MHEKLISTKSWIQSVEDKQMRLYILGLPFPLCEQEYRYQELKLFIVQILISDRLRQHINKIKNLNTLIIQRIMHASKNWDVKYQSWQFITVG